MFRRTEIDGLRAFAILPVLFYHAGFAWMPGGFFGVDVFFVISGFLITGILIQELNQTGRLSIIGFYERRARRILPALFAVIAVSFVAAWILMFTDQFKTFMQSVVSILYFGSNVFFLNHTGYFDADINLNPMVHTWSLAIEEQFYIFFPLILWLLWKFVPKGWRIPTIAVLGIASFVYAATWHGDTSSAFYLLQFRAWELIAGGLTSFLLSSRDFRPIPNQALSILGFVGILFSVFLAGNQFPHPGFITLIPILGSCLVLAFTDSSGLVGKLLNLKLFVGIGLISYSAYLWHQPLFSFFRISQLHAPSPMAFIPLIAGALLLAYLSWRFIENPVRDRKKISRRTVFAGAAVLSVVVLAVSFAGTRVSVNDSRSYPNTGIKYSSVAERTKANRGLSDSCRKFVGALPACETTATPEVLVWGDSHAMQIVPALQASETKLSFTQQTLSACAPVLDLAHPVSGVADPATMDCLAENTKVFQWLKTQSSIHYVIMASPWDSILNPESLTVDSNGVAKVDQGRAFQKLRATILAVQALGKKVVLVSPTAKNLEDTGLCLQRAYGSGVNLSACDFSPKVSILKDVRATLRHVEDLVNVFDLQKLICSPSLCRVSVGSTFIYRDYGHLSVEGSAYLGKKYDFMGTLIGMAR